MVETLARSCRHLTILKLSDYRVADPTTLLVLCGKRVAGSPANNRAEREEKSNGESLALIPAQREAMCTGIHAINNSPFRCFHNVLGHQQQDSQHEQQFASAVVPIQKDCEKMTEQMESLSIRRRRDCLGNDFVLNELGQLEQSLVASEVHKLENKGGEYNILAPNAYNGSVNSLTESENEDGNEFRPEGAQAVPEAAMYGAGVGGTREERENALSKSEQVEANGNQGDSDSNDEEDLYEDDVPMSPLVVDDHSAEFGCLSLETLWLDNVNITDPVAAVLMQNLPRLRDLNLSDTDICNPWRLLKPSQSSHLRLLCHLDVKSTALSRTALEMVPKFHPDLQKFSISSTTLPPHTYANIGRLTGVADLELIGGQFYPCEPEEIFQQGIAPAVCGIGKHLCSLNLTYFAHIEFEVIVLNCPKIEQLDLSFTGISLTYPCASLGACCPYLTTLNLAYCHIDAKEKKQHENHDPPEISQERVLECMIGQPPNLEELHLNGLSVPDAAVKGIFPGLSHPLRTLDISRCKLITIAGVVHIWERCPHMQLVNMTNCKAITLADYQRFEVRCFKERPRFRVEGRIEWK